MLLHEQKQLNPGNEGYSQCVEKAVSAAERAAKNAGESPVGFTVDRAMEDWGRVSTSELVVIIDEYAGNYGVYDSEQYWEIVDSVCESVTERFSVRPMSKTTNSAGVIHAINQ
jgi:hypothetical protein